MRLRTYLLSYYILFLALLSGLKTIAFSQMSENNCCHQCEHSLAHQAVPLKKQQRKSSMKRVCNPFEMCKTCVSFSANVAPFLFSLITYQIEKHATVIDEAPKHLALDFWQPPKLS